MTDAIRRNWTPWTPPRRCVTPLEGPDGRRFDLRLAMPAGAAPASGWPCLVALDGDRFFDALAGAAEALAHRTAKTGVGPLVVAAVAHRAEEGAFEIQRTRDFTMLRLPEAGPGLEGGEGEGFRRFLIDTVLPAIADRTPIDMGRRTLFGHSLAGLFVLEAMERDPKLFDRWVSISPSLWWRTPDPAPDRSRLFLGYGDMETGRDMCSRIAQWSTQGDPRRAPRLCVAPEADHGSAPFALIPHILRQASIPDGSR